MEILLNPKYRNEVELLLMPLECVLKSKTNIYVSGPITTGNRHLQWHKKNSHHITESTYNQLRRQEIIDHNIQNIALIAKNVRDMSGSIVIEPASLELKHWTQDDYLLFWGKVIDKYVNTIVFVKNWEYSRGCVYEFYLGLINQYDLLDSNMKPININLAVSKIKKAIILFEKYSLDTTLQEKLFILINEAFRNKK